MKLAELKNINKKHWSAILVVVVFLLEFLSLNKNIAAIRFVDEEDNMALGMYLLRGEKLYGDLFSHHQPLGYVASGAIQQVTQPNSIYLLIKNHRLAVWAWGLGWSILLAAFFGPAMVAFALIYEAAKPLWLGHLFLAESLSVYPLVFLIANAITNKKIDKKTTVLIGISSGLTTLLLAPLWPAVALFVIWSVIKTKMFDKRLIYLVSGAVTILLTVVGFVSWPSYFHNVFVVNFGYYIPQDSGSLSLASALRALVTPLTALSQTGPGQSLLGLKLLSVIVVLNMAIWTHKKKWHLILGVGVGLALLNLRYVNPGAEIYGGFHLLPWVAGLVAVACLGVFGIEKQKTKSMLMRLNMFLLTIIIIWAGNWALGEQKRLPSLTESMFINYSEVYTAGRAIEIMSGGNQEEKLLTVPDGWLIYWQAKVSHQSKMLNYYQWMSQVPELSTALVEGWSEKPPEYVYYQTGVDLGLESKLVEYIQLNKNGQATGIQVHKTKLEKLTNNQKDQLRFLGFDI